MCDRKFWKLFPKSTELSLHWVHEKIHWKVFLDGNFVCLMASDHNFSKLYLKGYFRGHVTLLKKYF